MQVKCVINKLFNCNIGIFWTVGHPLLCCGWLLPLPFHLFIHPLPFLSFPPPPFFNCHLSSTSQPPLLHFPSPVHSMLIPIPISSPILDLFSPPLFLLFLPFGV